MKQRNRKNVPVFVVLISIVLIVIVIALAGSGGGSSPVTVKQYSPVIPETTKVLTSVSTQYLSSISSDGMTYTFSQTSSEIVQIEPGDVIVSEGTAVTPYGFLQRVINVSQSGEQVVIQTEPASLTDAIESGTVQVTKKLTPADLAYIESPVSFSRGKTANALFRAKSTNMIDDKLFFKFEDLVILDDDGNLSTTGDQIRVNGELAFGPEFNLDFAINKFRLESLIFTVGGDLEANTNFIAGGKIKGNRDVTLKTFYFQPIVVLVGHVPVVIVPVIELIAHIDVSLEGGLKLDFTWKFKNLAGASYERGKGWKPIGESSHEFSQSFRPTLKGQLTFYPDPYLRLSIYNTLGISAAFRPYVKATIDPFAMPCWDIAAGLKVPVGIQGYLFDRKIADFNMDVIGYEISVAKAQSACITNTTETSVVPTTQTEIVGTLNTSAISSTLICEPQIYHGVKHCTDINDNAHILVIDLNDPHVRVQTVLPEGPNGECNSVNPADKDPDPTNNCPWPYPLETVKSMLERYKAMGAVAIINTDYFGSGCKPRCQDHGAQGLAVRNGIRLDGPKHGVYNDIAYTSPSLAFSKQNSPLIGIPGSQQTIENGLQNTYYNTVGGGPVIVQVGQAIGNAACSRIKYPYLTCTDSNQSAAGLTNNGNLVLITAKMDAGGVAEYLVRNYAVHTALKFDGGTSSSMAWLDRNGVAQDYHPKTSTSPVVAEGLLIFSDFVTPNNLGTFSNSSTAMLFDVSGSMNEPDAVGITKLDAAKNSGARILDIIQAENSVSQGAEVAILSFSNTAWVNSTLSSDVGVAHSALYSLFANGGTGMPDGLRLAIDQFPAAQNSKPIIIMLSDGLPNIGLGSVNLGDENLVRQQVLDLATEAGTKGICIYTVGFGIPYTVGSISGQASIDEDFLKQVAANSGCGAYYNAQNATQLANVYVNLRHLSTGNILLSQTGNISQGQTVDIGNVQVPNNQSMILFTLNWPGSQLDAVLTDPSGTTVDSNYPNASFSMADTLASVIIQNPQPGDWKVAAKGVDVPEGITTYNAVLSARPDPNPPTEVPQEAPPATIPTAPGFPVVILILVVAGGGIAVYVLMQTRARSRSKTPVGVMSAQLVCISGELAGRVIPLQDRLLIGRGSGCTIRLNERAVSRQHATFRFANGHWYIQNMNSRTGTFVNEARVDATTLKNGDRIRIGSNVFEFRTNR